MTLWVPSARSVWTVFAAALGAAALALAILPFYVEVPLVVAAEATVLAGLGTAAAATGLARAQRVSAPAVFGAVAAALAAVLGVTAVLVGVITARGALQPTRDTAAVLRRQLQVSLGDFAYTGLRAHDLPQTEMTVTVRNKLPVARSFRLVVAGFDGEHRQVASASVATTLAAHATETLDAFGYVPDGQTAQRLTAATFRIIDATSEPA